ncbi:MAG: MmgE/PrpD family protein [Roseovarius sp.]|nr:MmgE/PrpD family protein [Roseovarius sp.]
MAEKLDRVLAQALRRAPESALAVMRLSLADWLAVGLAGQDEPVAQLTRDMVLAEAGKGEAALFGGGRVPARAAALANGAASHALDYDDTHFAHIGHPSVAVIPAALAMAERVGAGQDSFLRAVLAGCEASVRLGLLLGRGHYQTGFHQTATAGAFGATLAAVRLLSDDETVLRQALGLVSTRASGLKSQFGTMGKPYNAGIAAANGVEAALLAMRGFVSTPEAVDGALGFLETHHADGAGAGADGFLMEDVSLKFHACCHGLHAALEALSTLKEGITGNVDAVETVEVRTNPRWLTVCDKPEPQTGLEAKFSYRAVMALSLLGHETAALSTFDDRLVLSPRVVTLRDKVHVVARDEVPEPAAVVRVTTDGQTREAHHDLAAPLDIDTRAAKLQQKIIALHGDDIAGRIMAAAHGGDIAGSLAVMG